MQEFPEIQVSHNGTGPSAKRLLVLEPVTLDSSTAPANSNGVMDAWHLVRSRKWHFLAIALLGAVCAAFITFEQQPIYQARASLEILGPMDNSFGLQPGAAGAGYTTESYIQTQVKILQSASLRERVAAKYTKDNAHRTYVSHDRLTAWRSALGMDAGPPKRESRLAIPEFEVQVHAFENTHLVEITCDSADPNFSADYINTASSEYMRYQVEARWDAAQRTTEWLTRQIEALKRKLEESENQLQEYSRAAGLIYAEGRDSVQDERLKQLQSELSKAQSERVAKQSVYEVTHTSAADAIPQVIDNERLSGYQSKLTELRREAAELSSLYTPEHYKVARVNAQIAEVQAAFKRESESVLSRIRNDYQSAQRREALLLAAYVAQAQLVSEEAAKSIHYDVLKREVDTSRALYGSLLQKVKEATVMSALSANTVHVVDRAVPPRKPYKPNLLSNLLKGVGSGLLFAAALVLGADRINRSLRAPGEAEFHLKLPELGVIPEDNSARLSSSREPPPSGKKMTVTSSLAKVYGQLYTGQGQASKRIELVTWQNSLSIAAESFRGAIASILLSGDGQRPRMILVTSAGLGEGKSTTVSNLGIALAEINQKVLLVDADMRKPRLHQIFNESNSWGLSDLLREKTSLMDAPLPTLVRMTEVNNLYLLPSGPGTLSIAHLLYSNRMKELLARFRSEFDTVLIDTPPVLHISDARVLGQLADAAILVIRAGQTTRDAALSAKQRLIGDGIVVLGTILNGWDLRAKSRYGGYANGYYYDANHGPKR